MMEIPPEARRLYQKWMLEAPPATHLECAAVVCAAYAGWMKAEFDSRHRDCYRKCGFSEEHKWLPADWLRAARKKLETKVELKP